MVVTGEWSGQGATGIQCVEARDVAIRATMYWTTPPPNNYLAKNVNSAQAEKPCFNLQINEMVPSTSKPKEISPYLCFLSSNEV